MRHLPLWFFPAWCGDFRLERESDDRCLLTVIEPTEADRAKLLPFLAKAAERGWVAADGPGVADTGESIIPIAASMQDAGPLLATAAHGTAETWTAVRHTGGVLLVDGMAAAPVKEPVAAATVATPKQGCPAPAHAERRASEVLRTFSTTRQWSQWNAEGRMRLLGNVTGMAYHLYHRDEAAARGLPRLLIEARSGHKVCVWDDRVPPAEEALAIKFAVEHREGWLRSLTSRGLEAHTGLGYA